MKDEIYFYHLDEIPPMVYKNELGMALSLVQSNKECITFH